MNKVIRFAVIGTSKITDWFLSAAAHVKDFELTAVYSRSEEKGKSFAEKYGARYVFTDLNKMAESDLIDAVYVASPNALHAEQSILLLKHKKHVLCEKAFASNKKEVNEMIEAAKDNNVILMEAIKTEFTPGFKAVKNSLNRIGKIRRYIGNYCQYSSRYDKFKNGVILNAFKKELSNGSLMDIGVYCIHPMINLFGMPEEIKASAFFLSTGVDGEGNVLFKYDGMEGIVIYSKITNSNVYSEIQGEEGNIVIENINNFEKVKLILRNGEEEYLSDAQIKDNMCYELDEFINLIKKEDTLSAMENLKVSSRVMETMDEVRKQIGLVFPADEV